MLLRYIALLKIVQDEFSDIVVKTELHVDRIRLTLVDGSWVEQQFPNSQPYIPLLCIHSLWR